MSYSHIEIIGDIQYIQMYPEMYASKYDPYRLIQEVLDNALDEIINEYGTTVTIDFIDEDHVIVTDNGRGIPVHSLLINNEEQDSVEAICTKLFSGAKFNQKAYQTSVGLHGVGLCTVNALSTFCKISTKHDNTIYEYEFNKSKLVEKRTYNNNVNWKTRVEFKPNPQFFLVNKFPQDKINEKLMLVKSKLQHNCNIYFNNKLIPQQDMNQFVKRILSISDDIPLFRTSHVNDHIKIDLFITYDLTGSSNPETIGDVNLHICEGTYLTNVMTQITKIGEEIYNIERSILKNYLKMYVSISIDDAH